jgi:hypothetical protein
LRDFGHQRLRAASSLFFFARRSPSRRRCAAPALFGLRIAAAPLLVERDQLRGLRRKPAPRQAGVEGSGFSRIHLMSCMAGFSQEIGRLYSAISGHSGRRRPSPDP